MQVNFSHKALAFAEQIAHGTNSKNEIFTREQIFSISQPTKIVAHEPNSRKIENFLRVWHVLEVIARLPPLRVTAHKTFVLFLRSSCGWAGVSLSAAKVIANL